VAKNGSLLKPVWSCPEL